MLHSYKLWQPGVVFQVLSQRGNKIIGEISRLSSARLLKLLLGVVPRAVTHTEILGLGTITKRRKCLLLLSSCAFEGVIWLNSLIFLQLWLWFIN